MARIRSFTRCLPILIVTAALFMAPALNAQKSHMYVFASPGGGPDDSGATFHAGGGGEIVAAGLIGAGAEIGALTNSGSVRNSLGVFSVNGYGHLPLKGRLDPYVTGGYSLFFRSGTASGGNFGVGVNLPLVAKLGLKFEFRDHVISLDDRTSHWWQGRVGLTF